MASILAPLIPFSLAITFITLVAALWSHKINAIVLEPYLVSLIPKAQNHTHESRMKSFILGKHRPTSAVSGPSGILS